MNIASLRLAAVPMGSGATLLSIFVLGFALDLTPIRIVETAQAQPVTQPTQTLTLQPQAFAMPLGAAPAGPAPKVDIPRPRIPIGDDALEQIKKQLGAPALGDVSPIKPQVQRGEAPLTTCTTNSENAGTPSDIIGAVGPANLVVATNTIVGVYNKSTCAPIASTLLNTLFGAGSGEGYFDPQVLWDNTTGRFIVTAELTVTGNANQRQGFAISQDNTGTSWWVYNVVIINGATFFCVPDATAFWDYPHVGSVNGTNPKWVLNANVFPTAGGGFSNLLVINKTPTLSGGSTTISCFDGVAHGGAMQFDTAPPNVLDTNSIAYFLSTGSGSGSAIQRYALDTAALTLTITTAISVTSWTAAPNAAQPNGVVLDSLDGRFVAQTIQNGTNLWNVHSVARAGPFATARFYQFSTTTASPLFTRDLFYVSNDHIFNVSIATNATEAFITHSRTVPSDPTNGLAAMWIAKGSNSSNTGWIGDFIAISTSQYNGTDCMVPCRWGDNSSIQIDPSNVSNAWGFNQLITGSSQFNWTTKAALEAGPAVSSTATHDLNGDGKSDIVWRDTSGNTAVWLMNGTTVSSSGGLGVVATSWSIVGQRDFNGDGKADLLWHDTSGNTGMWFMNGTAVASTGGVGTISTAWSVNSTGDFNGDGKGDLLWRDTSGNMSMWFMNGASVTSSAGLGNVSTTWTIIATADFNGDGKADILWRDTGGNLAVWLMNGATVTSSAGLGIISSAWSLAGTGDFNGDGKFDLLWRDTSGNTAIWFMNGAAVSSAAGLGNVSTVWSVVQTGDYNGDGKSDIFWRDTSGNTALWFMNGATVSSSGSLGNISTVWTVQSVNAE